MNVGLHSPFVNCIVLVSLQWNFPKKRKWWGGGGGGVGALF
jgi:hypothetical protein